MNESFADIPPPNRTPLSPRGSEPLPQVGNAMPGSAPTRVGELGLQTQASHSPPNQLTRRVALNQLLFQAGNSLTTGTFFNYFVSLFSPSTFLLAVLMIIPETSQSLSVLVSKFRRSFQHQKFIWAACLVIARLFALTIPLCVLLNFTEHPEQSQTLTIIIACTVLWYTFQGIAYVHYLSWISELGTPSNWGQLFSWRQIGGLSIGLLFPLGMVYLRKWLTKEFTSPHTLLVSYAVIFSVGNLIVISSIFSMMRLLQGTPQTKLHPVKVHPPNRPATAASHYGISLKKSFLLLLSSRWIAAFFQGLTQAVLFKFAYSVLKVPLENYMLLVSLMLLVQIPCCWLAGRFTDRNHEITGLWVGMVLTSLALPFWYFSNESNWHITLSLAYLLWGAFGLVNVCGLTLCLKLSESRHTIQNIAWYEQVSGLVAGLAGLLGGSLLDQKLTALKNSGLPVESAYLTLILVSFAGRLLAPSPLLVLSSLRRREQVVKSTA